MNKKVTFIMGKKEQEFLPYPFVLKREGYEVQCLEDPPTLKDPEQVNLLLQQIIAFHPQVVVYVDPLTLNHTLDDVVINVLKKLRKQLRTDFPPAHVLVGNVRDLFLPWYYKQWVEVFLMSGLDIKRFLKEVEALLTYPILPNPELISHSLLSARLQQEEATATRHLLAHLAHAPQDGLGWSMLGDLYWGLGNFKAAEQAYTTAIGCPSTTEPYRPYYSRGLLRQSLGQYGLALGDFLQADKQVTYHSSLKWSVAENFKTLGFYHQAQSTYEQIGTYVINKSAILRQQIDQVKGCLEHPTPLGLGWGGVQPLEKEVPPPIVEILATTIPSTFESMEAIRPLLRLVEQFPDNPLVWQYLGHAYWYGGYEVEAEAAFAEMVKREPVSAVSHFIQGCLAYIKQDYETALGLFQQAEQGELTPADRLQLYSYRSRLYDRLEQTELAQQERQSYDQLSGVAFHTPQYKKRRHDYFERSVPLEKPITFNEQGLRPAKILLLGEESGRRPFFEKCCSDAGYIVRNWGIAEYTPPSLKYDPMIAHQILAWQPDLILCEMQKIASQNNPYYSFLFSLMYQIRQRSPGQSTYPRHLLYDSGELIPPFLPDLVTQVIDHCFPNIMPTIRELFQTIERLAHEANSALLKRDWSPPPNTLVADIGLYRFRPEYGPPDDASIWLAFWTDSTDDVGYGYGTAILTDGRHVRVWLTEEVPVPGGTGKLRIYHGTFIDVDQPEQVVILSIIGPLKP